MANDPMLGPADRLELRETEQGREFRYAYRRPYRITCLPDKQQQANRLEALRYKWGGYLGKVGVIQKLGDVLRRFWGANAED